MKRIGKWFYATIALSLALTIVGCSKNSTNGQKSMMAMDLETASAPNKVVLKNSERALLHEPPPWAKANEDRETAMMSDTNLPPSAVKAEDTSEKHQSPQKLEEPKPSGSVKPSK